MARDAFPVATLVAVAGVGPAGIVRPLTGQQPAQQPRSAAAGWSATTALSGSPSVQS